MKSVDVVISVYGKPFQTAVTLLSLVKFSGQHINKIYFIKEPKQPRKSDFKFIYELLGDKVIVHTQKLWLWYDYVEPERLSNDDYRRSIRYQFAWEESTADYLYVTHNDVLYEGDIIGTLLDNIGGKAGIGDIGQCWNCPAYSAKLCNGDKYLYYRPTTEELINIHELYPSPRKQKYQEFIDLVNPWPLPECRLNEWVALINLKVAKPETVPVGDAMPFGAIELDVGTRWFKDMSLKGYEFKNYNFNEIARHAWTNDTGNGHNALFDRNLYETSEAIAKEKLIQNFNLDAEFLSSFEKDKSVWKTLVKIFR